MNDITILDIISLIASFVAIYISSRAYNIRKSQLESVLYQSLATALNKFYEFSSKKSEFESRKALDDYERIKRLLKLEVLNQLEYACSKYMQGKVDSKSFKEYYKNYIPEWATQIEKLKTSEKKEVFTEIKTFIKIIEGKRSDPNDNFFISNSYIWILGSLTYLSLLIKFGF